MAAATALTILLALQTTTITQGLTQLRGISQTKDISLSRTCDCVFRGQNCFTEKPKPRLPYGDDNLVECKLPNEPKKSKFKLNYASFLQQSPQNQGITWKLTDNSMGPKKIRDHLRVNKNLPGNRTLYLAFDDGILCEDKNCTGHRDFLDLMDYYGVKTTQFVIANRFRTKLPEEHEEYNPCRTVHYSDVAGDILREYAERGHAIGSHTKGHIELTLMKKEGAKKDIMKADEIIRNYTGLAKINHFRAPYLSLNDDLATFLVDEMDYHVWGATNGGNADWQDWELPSTSANKYAKADAERVQQFFTDHPDQTSQVLCLHDRPLHRKHFGTVLTEMCAVCPDCEFKSLDD